MSIATRRASMSPAMEKCLAAARREGRIRVTFWGGAVFAMSPRGDIKTVYALVRRGLLRRQHVAGLTYDYVPCAPVGEKR